MSVVGVYFYSLRAVRSTNVTAILTMQSIPFLIRTISIFYSSAHSICHITSTTRYIRLLITPNNMKTATKLQNTGTKECCHNNLYLYQHGNSLIFNGDWKLLWNTGRFDVKFPLKSYESCCNHNVLKLPATCTLMLMVFSVNIVVHVPVGQCKHLSRCDRVSARTLCRKKNLKKGKFL